MIFTIERLRTLLTIPEGICACGCGHATRIARRTHSARGHVRGLPVKYVKGHNRRLTLADIFSRVTEEDRGFVTPCWIWHGAVNYRGYGRVGYRGVQRALHREVYRRLVGDVPANLDMDHLCRVRRCVRPDHLEPVTKAENTRRGVNTKLTETQIVEIRASTGTCVEVARRYGVGPDAISKIRRRVNWVDVPARKVA